MDIPKEIAFDVLRESNLYIDCVYRGGSMGHQGDDPLHPLTGVGNAGGFRKVGKSTTQYAVIFSTGAETDWPDHFENDGDSFIYFGDQRNAGSDVLDTPRGGNKLLKGIFELAEVNVPEARTKIPPLFLFRKHLAGRDVQFEGVLVPRGSSAEGHSSLETVVTETALGSVINFRATFGVLRPPSVDRSWFDDLRESNPMTQNGPAEWFKWLALGL